MNNTPTASIIHHFSTIKDPRVNRQKKHELQDIFFITLCAVICGADNWLAGIVMIGGQYIGASIGAKMVLDKGASLIRSVVVVICF